MTHPPGLVVVPCQENARYHRFTISISDLQLPEGSKRVYGIGTSIVQNLNSALEQMTPELEWAWMIGDDHTFEPDILMRLLDREADVIAPLCVQRAPNFPLMHYDRPLTFADGRGGQIMTEYFNHLRFEQLPEDGEPFPVAASGSALLIRRHVLEAIREQFGTIYAASYGLVNEDMDISRKIRACGFEILVDPEQMLGHVGHIIVYPQCRAGIWGLVIDFPGPGKSELWYPGGIDEMANLGKLEAAAA